MTRRKPSPRDKEATKERLVRAVGSILARDGFKGLGVNSVARRAGVDKVLVYRYFGGLPELVAAFAQGPDFWPTAGELLAEVPEEVRGQGMGLQLAWFLKSFLAALRRRPVTLDILAWELAQSGPLAGPLHDVRIRVGQEFLEALGGEPRDGADLEAVLTLAAGAVNYLAVRYRNGGMAGGIDLGDEQGWRRVEAALSAMLVSALD